MTIAESKKIKRNIDKLSLEEFDKILYDCGIESIKPSIQSEYITCLNILTNTDYRKSVTQYFLQEEYFEVEKLEQEVA